MCNEASALLYSSVTVLWVVVIAACVQASTEFSRLGVVYRPFFVNCFAHTPTVMFHNFIAVNALNECKTEACTNLMCCELLPEVALCL